MLAVPDALLEIAERVLALGPPEESLHIALVVFQHTVASSLGLAIVVHFQVAHGLIQLACLLQFPCLCLDVFRVIVDVCEYITDLLVAPEGQVQPARLEERIPEGLALVAELQLLLVRHVPRLLTILELLHLELEDDRLATSANVAQAQSGLRGQRWARHGQRRPLEPLHVRGRALERVAHLPAAEGELQHLARKARDQRVSLPRVIHT
mmetsp:Transcript_125759/g.337423  ORF Transcript_125759/g.337423 Transcript_125759/m.337423 type:complete len:209 (+) Transcript_125759:507-1133(+)